MSFLALTCYVILIMLFNTDPHTHTHTQLTLHDTAGLERFEGTVPPSYFRSASAVIFVYSLSNQESIANINDWSDSVSPQRLDFVQTDTNIIRALAGNKSDLDERVVSKQRAREVAENCGIKSELICELSALSGEGFDELFVAVTRQILSRGKSETAVGPAISLRAGERKKSGSGSGCCR